MHHDTLIVVLLSEHEPHHAARLKLYLLFKITSLYVAEFNTDFRIGLLFLIDRTSIKVCVRLPLKLWVDDEEGRSVVWQEETVGGTVFTGLLFDAQC